MKLKDFKLFILFCFISLYAIAQQSISGKVIYAQTKQPLNNVKVYDKVSGFITQTNKDGKFQFDTDKEKMTLMFYSFEYQVEEITINTKEVKELNVTLLDLSETLSEVQITARKEKIFELKHLKDVEGTSIYAGKKTEVVLVDQSMANLASNNARQIYAQVAGLNIYQNDDGGLQLNIGGRGLDPNRTANFNTRQNGYDISADVLGYPESYYTPASEGLGEVQVIRGAASLQYGTQFGGLINFKTKKPNPNKPIEVITRNTLGSFGLYTNFTSLSGTSNKFSYYTYFNYKRGDGFRPNSQFESKNVFGHLGYQFSKKTKLEAEVTYLRYLAKQAGGLTDRMFNENHLQSNRARNWFKVNWFLYNLKLSHEFSENTNFTFHFFGLNASRNALGFRSNRVSDIDPGKARNLISGEFNNYGFESRLLTKYKLLKKDATFLIGTKFYKANNNQQQGPGTDASNPDFNSAISTYPNYSSQSEFTLPNINVSVFGENIVYLSSKFSITPGFRFEYIKTGSDGFFKKINLDGAGNVILNETVPSIKSFERSFILLGLGASYKPTSNLEVYANASQNYRSVTFSDINITNPAFKINPNITDENGLTTDLGIRGNIKNYVSYDANVFGLFYKNRIGFLQKVTSNNQIFSERGNVGDAFIYGLESLLDFNLKQVIGLNDSLKLNYFINTSVIHSEYTKSNGVNVVGKRVEFVPELNFKTGLKFGYKNLLINTQYSYLGSQFTDASNSPKANQSGVIGPIPEYDIFDLSLSYKYKRYKLETGVNNLLNNTYFTRRATGYPGPGIIPSSPRNFYATLQVKI